METDRKVMQRKVAEKEASPGEESTRTQVTTKKKRDVTTTKKRDGVKRDAVALKKTGTASGQIKRMRAFLRQKLIDQNAVTSFRPNLKSCRALQPGGSCQGECGQGVACGRQRPKERHHLLIIPERKKCTVIAADWEAPHRSGMVHRKRPALACITQRPSSAYVTQRPFEACIAKRPSSACFPKTAGPCQR